MATLDAAHVLNLENNWTLDLERKKLEGNATFTLSTKNLQEPQGMQN